MILDNEMFRIGNKHWCDEKKGWKNIGFRIAIFKEGKQRKKINCNCVLLNHLGILIYFLEDWNLWRG